jgi:hypothetical protein
MLQIGNSVHKENTCIILNSKSDTRYIELVNREPIKNLTVNIVLIWGLTFCVSEKRYLKDRVKFS